MNKKNPKENLKKEVQDALKAEMRPLMLGLRESVDEMTKAVTDGAIFVKGAKPEKPIVGVDYFTDEDKAKITKQVTPKLGVDYFTEADKEEIIARAKPRKGIDYRDGRKGKDGTTPKKGVDYFTENEVARFIEACTPKKGVHYKDGAPGTPAPAGSSTMSAEEIRNKLEGLKGTARLSIDAVKGLRELINEATLSGLGGSGGTGGGTSLPDQTGNAGKFLTTDGTTASWGTPAGSGDMVLASAQTVTGVKTFLNGTMGLRNVANTFTSTFTNTNTAARTYTLKDASGTLAFTSDITGTNSGVNTGDQTITLTGGVTGSGTGSFAATVVTNANLTGPITSVGNATSVGANVITNAMRAQMATLTIKGNNTGGTANEADLTVAQVNAILPVFTSILNGLVPASSGGTANFLRADGTFAPPPGGSGFTPVVNNYTASTTMADPGAGCSLITVEGIGGGAGGGSGRKHTSAAGRAGGSGGSAGASFRAVIKYSDVSSWPVTITIGAGGAGGAAITSNSTAGANGTDGGDTSFGTYVVFKGGRRGLGGQSGTIQGGDARLGSQTAVNTMAANVIPGAGGQSGVTAATIGAAAGGVAGSGGGGAGLTTANATMAGGNGGSNMSGATVSAGGAATVAGTNGADGDTTAPYVHFGGNGGSGAGSSTTAGLAGGNGGLYGAGGGGGSAGTDSVNNSGKGGDGAQGFLRVIAT